MIRERERKVTHVINTSDQGRRRAIRAATPVAALLVAALLVWQGSNAAFSATTDNTANAWETGNLVLTNNGGGTSFSQQTTTLFDETNLRPGDSDAKCITVHSGGSLDGDLRIYRGAVTGDAGLGDELLITVDAEIAAPNANVGEDCSGYGGGTSGSMYKGSLNDMDAAYADAASLAVAGGAQRVVYRIGWTLDPDAGNSVMGNTVQTDLVWEIN